MVLTTKQKQALNQMPKALRAKASLEFSKQNSAVVSTQKRNNNQPSRGRRGGFRGTSRGRGRGNGFTTTRPSGIPGIRRANAMNPTLSGTEAWENIIAAANAANLTRRGLRPANLWNLRVFNEAYANFRFTSVKWRYVGTCPTTTAGSIFMGNHENFLTVPNNARSCAILRNSITIAPYQTTRWYETIDHRHPEKWFRNQPLQADHNGHATSALNSHGFLYYTSTGGVIGTYFGRIELSYTCIFENRIIDANAVVYQDELDKLRIDELTNDLKQLKLEMKLVLKGGVNAVLDEEEELISLHEENDYSILDEEVPNELPYDSAGELDD